jgi:hypothetical protein
MAAQRKAVRGTRIASTESTRGPGSPFVSPAGLTSEVLARTGRDSLTEASLLGLRSDSPYGEMYGLRAADLARTNSSPAAVGPSDYRTPGGVDQRIAARGSSAYRTLTIQDRLDTMTQNVRGVQGTMKKLVSETSRAQEETREELLRAFDETREAHEQLVRQIGQMKADAQAKSEAQIQAITSEFQYR